MVKLIPKPYKKTNKSFKNRLMKGTEIFLKKEKTSLSMFVNYVENFQKMNS